MTRYIDADELLKKEHTISIKEIGYSHRCVDREAVLDAPTADVIPVDFIKEQIRICETIPAPTCAEVLRALISNYKMLTVEIG